MASQRLLYPVFTNPSPAPLRLQATPAIPVLRPRLPLANEIRPYIESIDESCWYSNYGPLVTHLEDELSVRLGARSDCVVTVANATLGLMVALLARRARPGSLCIMPAWTFAATPHAARAAGMVPYFHDIDPGAWALDPDAVLSSLPAIRSQVGAVIVVSPFGAPVDVEAWEDFEDRSGVPVIIDGAAGFDTVRLSRIPTVVSLHATKILAAGEGGFVVTGDPELRDRVRASCNFGFLESRTAAIPAVNAKMSEYHGAVALAALARWPETRARHMVIANWYKNALDALENVSLQPGYGDGWVTATTNVLLPQGSAAFIGAKMLESGVDTRQWWGLGCHVQPAFDDCPHGPLGDTDDLASRVLGLPHFPDMRRRDIARVVDALTAALNSFALSKLAERIPAS